MLSVGGVAKFGVDFASVLSAKLRDGIMFISEYSGVGAPEECLHRIVHVAREHNVQVGKIRCMRAGEILEPARRILRAHASPPVCIFGDVLSRAPPYFVNQFKHVHAAHLQKACALIGDGVERKEAFKCVGKVFMKRVNGMLQQRATCNFRPLVAHCYQHGCQCGVIKCRIPGVKGLKIMVLGQSCVDWSSVGKQQGWLGKTSIIFAEVLAEIMADDYDIIIFECTVMFDYDTGLAVLRERYLEQRMHLCPSQVGVPCLRPRTYSILLRRGVVEWSQPVFARGVQASFNELFAQDVSMNGDSMARAPQWRVDEHVESMATTRGFPERRVSGRRWRPYQLLPPGQRRRLRSQELHLHIDGIVNTAPLIINLMNNRAWSPPQKLSPTLLRNSILWLMRFQRLCLPSEHMEMQGFGMHSTGMPGDDLQSSFADEFHALPFQVQRALAGNTMHTASIGLLLMFVLGCTVLVPAESYHDFAPDAEPEQ